MSAMSAIDVTRWRFGDVAKRLLGGRTSYGPPPNWAYWRAPQLIDAIDIPTVGVGAKERVDVLAIRTWITTHQPQHAVIERGQAMPKQGGSSGFKCGRAVGAIEAVIACCGIPLTIVEPSTWKKFHQLRGGVKEGSRQRALQLFPTAQALLTRKRDHGRADAAIIALAAGAPIKPNLLKSS